MDILVVYVVSDTNLKLSNVIQLDELELVVDFITAMDFRILSVSQV